jgi:hypothetical protein
MRGQSQDEVFCICGGPNHKLQHPALAAVDVGSADNRILCLKPVSLRTRVASA